MMRTAICMMRQATRTQNVTMLLFIPPSHIRASFLSSDIKIISLSYRLQVDNVEMWNTYASIVQFDPKEGQHSSRTAKGDGEQGMSQALFLLDDWL